jgi:hypothetical protein
MEPIIFNIILALIVSWVTWKSLIQNYKFRWLIAFVSPLLPLAIYTPIWINARIENDSSDAWAAYMAIIGVVFCYGGSVLAIIASLFKAKPNAKT